MSKPVDFASQARVMGVTAKCLEVIGPLSTEERQRVIFGLVIATREFQDNLKLREGLLVGFFLSGLVTLGSLQSWWLKPLISGMDGAALYYGATALTAITDNAALTYLGSLVEGITPELKYALVNIQDGHVATEAAGQRSGGEFGLAHGVFSLALADFAACRDSMSAPMGVWS